MKQVASSAGQAAGGEGAGRALGVYGVWEARGERGHAVCLALRSLSPPLAAQETRPRCKTATRPFVAEALED